MTTTSDRRHWLTVSQPCLPPDRLDRRIRHPRRRCEGQGPEGGRPSGYRIRCRRARLPDAAGHRRGRHRGRPRPEEPPLHPRGRPARAARSDRGEDGPRLGIRRQGERGARHQRRQAGRLPGVRDAARPRRRGAAAGAVLDHLSRSDRARRRRHCAGRHRRVDRVPRHREPARSRPHAAHEGPALLLAVQPDRRGLPRQSKLPRSDVGPSSTASG